MKATREEILNQAEQRAYANERDYRGCSQSVLAALQDTFDMRDDQVFRAASGLAGGIGLTIESSCGSLSGGCMFIGQLCGRQREADGSFLDEENRRFQAYQYCNLFAQRFFQEYGSCNCKEIQKVKFGGRSFVLTDPQQREEFHALGGHTHICPEVVGKAARWVAEVILDHLGELGLADKIQLK